MTTKYLILLFLFILSACGHAPETVDDIKSGLESELGGYQLDDELAAFGRPDLDFLPISKTMAMPVVPEMGYALDLEPGGPAGAFGGYWIDFEKGYGVMAGKWADREGRIRGHLKGIYGYSRSYADWVFFGKLIDHHGRGLGILSGRHVEGLFRGTWIDAEQTIRGEIVGYAAARGEIVGQWRAAPFVEARGPGEMPWHLLH